jgi:phosphatidylinositol alpha-1,6-mannosyltransferase
MKHLLVTNDFPPKVGGIQNLLWEWWRRLPPDSFAVLTSPHKDAADFDAQQPYLIRRTKEPVLLPHPWMIQRINEMAEEIGADFVVLDPAVPLGIVGPSLKLPYMVVLHGSEVTVPGRLPGSKQVLSRVLRGAQHIIAAGGYPAAEARQAGGESLPITVVPPGVDTQRFVPITDEQRKATRSKFGLEDDAELIVGVSRLVPRKGFDTLIRAAAALAPSRPKLRVVIGGKGRDTDRLQNKLALRSHWRGECQTKIFRCCMQVQIFRQCCVALGGVVWNKKDSELCFLKQPHVGCLKLRVRAVARRRRLLTA